MAAPNRKAIRPVDMALQRLLDLATKNAPPSRMAREVEIIAVEWSDASDADPAEIKQQVGELLEVLMAGVTDAKEQASDVDRNDASAAKQADFTLAALVATHDAAARVWAAL